jgi:hypothetical protein
LFIALTLAVLVLAACSLGNGDPVMGNEAEFQPNAQVTLTCSPTCANYGQCGTATGGTQVVLGGWGAPLVENHDRRFIAGQTVTVLASNLQTIESVMDNTQSQLRFYQIQPPDAAEGWVAGWCVASQ